MEIARIGLTGAPVRVERATDPSSLAPDVLGVDVAGRLIDGVAHTVVQVMLDDDRPGFDDAMFDAPLLAEVVDDQGALLARELVDHDRFRRQLQAERDAGRSERRGVLLLSDGSLPPPWIRLCFMALPLDDGVGATLVLRRTSVEELVAGVEHSSAEGALTDNERIAALTAIEHLHGPPT
jgi:hypothetical protein